jgi:hypothetical protein
VGKQAVTLGCDYLPTNMHCRLETIAVQAPSSPWRLRLRCIGTQLNVWNNGIVSVA